MSGGELNSVVGWGHEGKHESHGNDKEGGKRRNRESKTKTDTMIRTGRGFSCKVN